MHGIMAWRWDMCATPTDRLYCTDQGIPFYHTWKKSARNMESMMTALK